MVQGEGHLPPARVSIPLRKFRKGAGAAVVQRDHRVSIPLRKFRKNSTEAAAQDFKEVSIPLRKFRKLSWDEVPRLETLRFHPSKEV